jgi:RNA polymerase sigma-70 factor (ECF subfamily)
MSESADGPTQWRGSSAGPYGSPEEFGRALEACRRYLLLVADRTLDADLRAKLGPSDLVQESLLEAQRDIGRFRGSTDEELRRWLRKILLHNVATAREHYRGARKRSISREVPLDGMPDGPGGAPPAAGDPTPSKRAATREDARRLEEAMARLPDHYREALRLRHQEDCSFEEIGRRTDRSAEAARKVWARAVEHLKQTLNAHDDATG